MSPATSPVPTAVPVTGSRRLRPVLLLLLVAAVMSTAAGLVATAMFMRTIDVAQAPGHAPAPSAPPLATSTGRTTVPDANAVLSGREVELEAPSPTF